jgi:hypothetical protein
MKTVTEGEEKRNKSFYRAIRRHSYHPHHPHDVIASVVTRVGARAYVSIKTLT